MSTNLLEKFENDQMKRLSEGKDFPQFKAGDTVRVNAKIIEGKNERIQAFEGLCIAVKNAGLNSAFTVRKISHGEGVERVFPLYSPRIESIKVVRRGIVRRSKLYYMRELTGKAARIQEKKDFANNNNGENSKGKAKAKAESAPKAETKEVKEGKADNAKPEAKPENKS